MNQPIPFLDFLKGTTQEALAKRLGVTQGAISKMKRSGRNLFVGTRPNGKVFIYEVRTVKDEALTGDQAA